MLKSKLPLMALTLCLLTLFSPGIQATRVQAQEPIDKPTLPLSSSSSVRYVNTPSLTFAQQTARYEAEQRAMRIQWNNWIGHSPLRPHMNASFMSNGVHRYYVPYRGIILTDSVTTAWYW